MKDFKDKVVVITGGGSGIGRALALDFASRGAKLAINDINEQGIEATCQSLPEGTACFTAIVDTANKAQSYEFAEAVYAHYGQVDVVINNAGVALGAVKVDELKYDDFEWIMGINFWGMVYGTKAFLPYLRQRPEASLVNISSILGIMGLSYQAAYCTTKFAIRGFTESLRMELSLEESNIVASSVHPGGIITNIAKNSRNADAKMTKAEHQKLTDSFKDSFITSPEKAAQIIIKGIQKKQARIMVGPDSKFMALITRLFPAAYQKIMMRQFRKSGMDNYVNILKDRKS